MRLSRPFIRLPYAFDAERLAAEVEALPDSAWMPHPSGMRGNSAVALVSRDGGDNDDFDGRMLVTPHLERCPYVKQAMAAFGEVLARSRLMRLAPGSEVSSHVDFNYHWYTRVRIHVPVVTESEVIFHCGDARLHMQAGECWIFDSWRRHRVVNGGREDRVHLVIDIAGSSRFWATVRDMERLDESGDVAGFDDVLRHVGYAPQSNVRIETEQHNTAPVMAPGELDALVADLVRDFAAHPHNDPALVERYRILLVDFSKDWREAWSRHGYRRSGWRDYGKLIEQVRAQLHPEPRALVTASNQVGVNPIIVQRILRPALATDRLAQFVDEGSSPG